LEGRPQNLSALTSLRFVAAILVVLFHYGQSIWEPSAWGLRNMLKQGFLGVGFFYALSGFVLVHAYVDPTSPLQRSRFWLRRAARILPAYLLSLLIAAPTVALHHISQSGLAVGSLKTVLSALVNLLLLQAWLPFASSAWNSPSWSVSVEAFFYLCFPWCLAPIRRLRPHHAAFVFLVVWILGLIPSAYELLQSSPGTSAPSVQSWIPIPLRHLTTFVCGMCARQLCEATALSQWLQRLGSGSVALCCTASLAILCFDSSRLEPLPMHLYVPIWVGMFIAIYHWRPQRYNVLCSRPFIALGHASYALYILQAPIFTSFVATTHAKLPLSLSLLGYYLSILLTISILVWRYIELPAKDWWESRLRRRPLENHPSVPHVISEPQTSPR